MGTNEEQEFLSGVRKSVESGRNYQPHAGEEAERPTTHRWTDPGWNEETSLMFSVLYYDVSALLLPDLLTYVKLSTFPFTAETSVK